MSLISSISCSEGPGRFCCSQTLLRGLQDHRLVQLCSTLHCVNAKDLLVGHRLLWGGDFSFVFFFLTSNCCFALFLNPWVQEDFAGPLGPQNPRNLTIIRDPHQSDRTNLDLSLLCMVVTKSDVTPRKEEKKNFSTESFQQSLYCHLSTRACKKTH